jgi:hypothetical protein
MKQSTCASPPPASPLLRQRKQTQVPHPRASGQACRALGAGGPGGSWGSGLWFLLCGVCAAVAAVTVPHLLEATRYRWMRHESSFNRPDVVPWVLLGQIYFQDRL